MGRSTYTRKGFLLSIDLRGSGEGSGFRHFGAYILNELPKWFGISRALSEPLKIVLLIKLVTCGINLLMEKVKSSCK